MAREGRFADGPLTSIVGGRHRPRDHHDRDQLPWCIRTSGDNHARRPDVVLYLFTGLEFGPCFFRCPLRVAPNGTFRDATCTRHDGRISR